MKSHFKISVLLVVIVFIKSQILFADNTLEIVNAQTNVNTTVTVSVNMQNDSAIVAFQIDLPIPMQLSYVPGTAALNTSRVTDHIISDTLLPDGTLRILGYSLSNTPFSDNSGELFTFDLQAGDFPGSYYMPLSTAVLGNTQSSNIITGYQNGTLLVMGPDISVSSSSIDFGRVPLLGTNDQYITIYNNGNTVLNISQINSSNQYFTVLGYSTLTINPSSSTGLQLRFASQVKGTYSEILTIISDDADEASFEIEMSSVAFAVNEMHTGNMFAFSGDYATLDFTINNMEPVVGFQFDLNLPQSMSYVADSAFLTNRKANHAISANLINDNTLRVVVFSSDNQWFTGNDGHILTLGFNIEGVGGYYGINLGNVVIGDILGLNAISAYSNGSLQIAAADISATSSVNFGDVSILEISSESITIYNYGSDTLEIQSIQFTNSSFLTQQSLPLLILPGNNSQVDLTFGSLVEGNFSGIGKIYSNDPDENSYNINLTGNAFVPNYINVNDSMYSYGDTMFVDIDVDNLETFTGFQFDLNFTDSLTYVPDLAYLSQRAGDHIVQVSDIDSNSIRILAFSLSQSDFTGNSGSIISIPFIGDTSVYGKIPFDIENAILGNSQSEDILWGINNDSIIIAKSQSIDLQAGWNMMSFNVTPNNINLDNIIQPLIDSLSLIKIINESGNIIQDIPGIGWLNTIGDMHNTEGYYIKVNTSDTLVVEGCVVKTPYSILLYTGWNILGYPLQYGQDAITALQPLINSSSFIKIINESGGFIQFIPGLGWLNTIGTLEPGEGYYIKMSNDEQLVLDNQASKSLYFYDEPRKTQYFKSLVNSNPYQPMNIIIPKIESDGFQVEAMDEIGVFSGELCVGSIVIGDNVNTILNIITTADDPTTVAKDGFCEGDTILFNYWDVSKAKMYNNIEISCVFGEDNFMDKGTFVAELRILTTNINEFFENESPYLLQNYPNPFSNKTTIKYGVPYEGEVSLIIYDENARKVKILRSKLHEKGEYSIEFDRSNLIQGNYYIKMDITSGENVISTAIKMIVM